LPTVYASEGWIAIRQLAYAERQMKRFTAEWDVR
jgi:hypothetical protein